MKPCQKLLTRCLLILSFSCCAYASILAFNQPTPQQSFHPIGAISHEMHATHHNVNPASEQKGWQDPSTPISNTHATTATTNVYPQAQSTQATQNSMTEADSSGVVVHPPSKSQTQMTALTKNERAFQQLASQKILQLTQQNMLLQQELKQLQSSVQAISQQLQQVNRPPVNTAANSISNLFKRLDKTNSTLLFICLGLLILWLFTWGIGKRSKKSPTSSTDNTNVADDSEYDFMNTQEATPVKLDLARAYLAMEDYAGAQVILQQVLDKGDQKYHAEAKELLNIIPKTA